MESEPATPVGGADYAGANHYDFAGRVAVVTGGAQGIGFGVAQRIVAGGGAVALWDWDGKMLDEAGARFGDGARVLRQRVDVSDLGAVEAAAREVVDHFGRIDILINNAALVGPNVPTWEYPPDAFRDVVNVGLTGAFYCCRAVVPYMMQSGYGRIVNVSSIAGKEGNPNAVAYSSAKAGLLALTKSLGKELAGYDIAVNAVTPAFAKTALAMTQSPQHIEYILSKIPRGRMLDVAEATSMICWLATAENSFTTAAVFDLSGGRATY
ncbi:MAG: SDR family oxidoreductase [Sphingomonadales bacterium]|nr:SDR family oxidoreductase [Sphingomonadales bacterium]